MIKRINDIIRSLVEYLRIEAIWFLLYFQPELSTFDVEGENVNFVVCKFLFGKVYVVEEIFCKNGLIEKHTKMKKEDLKCGRIDFLKS